MNLEDINFKWGLTPTTFCGNTNSSSQDINALNEQMKALKIKNLLKDLDMEISEYKDITQPDTPKNNKVNVVKYYEAKIVIKFDDNLNLDYIRNKFDIDVFCYLDKINFISYEPEIYYKLMKFLRKKNIKPIKISKKSYRSTVEKF